MKNYTRVVLLIAIILILAILGFLKYWYTPKQEPSPSSQQPTEDVTKDWQTYQQSEYGFTLKYPKDFFDANHEPKLLAGDCNWQVFPGKCPDIKAIVLQDMTAQGSDTEVVKSDLARADYWDVPEGTKQTINGVQYCLYTTGDSATGHAFNYYYYATVRGQKCAVVYLSTVTPNCDFYLPLEQGNTEQAKNYQDCLDHNQKQPGILNTVISTFTFSK